VVPDLAWTGERLVPQVGGDIAYEHLHRYAVAADMAHGKVVLDLACGEGYGANLLARVASEVIGIDADAGAVEHARLAYRADNLRFDVGACAAVPIPTASVDLVVSFETIEHHTQHQEMMAEIRRVLRPGGLLIISTPDRREYSELPQYRNSFHVRELSRAEFGDLLAGAFEHSVVYGQRMSSGTVIAPLDDRPVAFVSHRGGFGGGVAVPGLSRAMYLIGLAWDGHATPALPASLFEGDGIPTGEQARAAALAAEVERLTAAVADRDAALHRLKAAILGETGSNASSPSANGTSAAERLAREHVAILESLAARVEALPASAPRPEELAWLRDQVWYWRLICRIRQAAGTVIPNGATVAVVTRGDDRLLDLGNRRAWHFPRATNGEYAGCYPTDDAGAIAHLEALRAEGAEYFLIPGNGLWWLTDYAEFGHHVRGNYEAVYRNADECLIFNLKSGANGRRVD
jgi:SAM-dependent methyltransferase